MTEAVTSTHDSSQWIRAQVAIATVAAIGAGLAFYATSLGLGTEVDSATYLMAARNLLAGKGLSLQLVGSANSVPLTWFPPLLPGVLAMIGYAGIDLSAGARWLNIVLYGADIFLVAVFVKRYTGSRTAAVFSALLMTTTTDVLVNHCMLVSEPLFLFCILSGLIFIARYLETPSLLLLFGFSAAFAAAGATRYIGGILIPVGAGAIVFGSKNCPVRRIHLGAYASIFAFPLLLWLMRNMILVHTLTNHHVGFHPPGFKRFAFSYLSLSTWLLPAAIPALLRIVILAIAVLLLVRAAFYGFKKSDHQRSPRTQLDVILVVLLFFYLLGFVVTQTFFDAQIWIAGRHLLLVYVIGAMVIISQVRELFNSRGPYYRAMCLCLCVTLIGLGAFRTGKNTLRLHQNGIGLSSKHWQTSELIMKTKELDGRLPIITNSWALVYLRTGKLADAVPSPVDSQTERLDPTYIANMARIRDEIQRAGAVVVYFTAFQSPQGGILAADDIETRLGLRRLATTSDGYILGKL
jgi:hypothetical protein